MGRKTDGAARADVDAAARIVLENLHQVLARAGAAGKRDPAASMETAMLMGMRLYADFIGDDAAAIRQIRLYADVWEERLNAETP